MKQTDIRKTLTIAAVALSFFAGAQKGSKTPAPVVRPADQFRFVAVTPSRSPELFTDPMRETIIASLDSLLTAKRISVGDSFNEADLLDEQIGVKVFKTCRSYEECPNFLHNRRKSPAPYVGVNGEDSIAYFPDEVPVFVYPPDFYELVEISGIVELRVKEEAVFNETTQAYEFIPVAFSVVCSEDRFDWEPLIPSTGRFWITISELKSVYASAGTPLPLWVEAIVSKNYKGFQYRQFPFSN